MPGRIALFVVAVVAASWLALALHHVRLEADANGLATAHPSAARVDRILGVLRRAESHNPDVRPKLLEVTVLGLGGRNREAAELSRSVLRDEPDNLRAAIGLYVNLRVYDPAGAAQAAARIRSIAPQVKR